MITIVVGTNRINSNSSKVALYYQRLLTEKGAESQILSLIDLPDDFIVSALYQNSGKNEAMNGMRATIESSKKFVWVVPEYNHSFPGVLKAFIDGLKYPTSFLGKHSALVGVANGTTGNIMGLSHLTDIFNYLGMNVLPLKVKLAQIDKHMDAEGGAFTNQLYTNLLDQQAELLIKA